MIRLHFYGAMAKSYGSHIDLDAATPREAITALSFQIPGYREYVSEREWHIILGKFDRKNKKGNDITEDELDLMLGDIQEVHLVPKIAGSGKAFNFIAGAVLFVVGAVAAFGYGQAWGSNLMWMGGSMMLGGLVQMTTKIPKAENIATEPEDKRASFLYNGPINSSTQGAAISRGYGKMLIGSTVVSGMVYAEQLKA